MELWSWICDVPTSDQCADSENSPLIFQLSSSNSTHSIQIKADRTYAASDSEASVTFSVCFDQQKTLWISDTCPLSSEMPFLPLVLQLIQEIVSLSPTAHDSTCPRSQLQRLKPEPVSWILDSHSPDSFSAFFNLIFLTRLFWLCVCDAPAEVGCFFFNSLLAPNLDSFSRRDAPVLRAFFVSVGVDVEICIMRTVGYMLAKWLILREVGMGLALPSSPSSSSTTSSPSHNHHLGLSYATEAHGLWILKGYAPVWAMRRTRFNGEKDQYPFVEAQESVLRYALAHQQLEALIQLEYTVGYFDGYIQVNARVNNLRLHVARLGFKKKHDEGSYVDERHFPSRVRVWVGPEVGATYVAGLTLGRSTDNVERETETQKIVKGSFGKLKVPKVKAMSRTATRMKTRNWRWDMDAEGNAAIFDSVLCDHATGAEVATWNPSSGAGAGEPGSGFRNRYAGPTRPFTKGGGVVFSGEECGEGVGWRVSREMEGSVLKWRIGGEVWLSYWPNNVKSSYFETRCVEWCHEVDLPLIPNKN